MSEAGKGDCNDNKRPTLHTYRHVPFQDKTKGERKMKLWERLFGKNTATKKPGAAPTPSSTSKRKESPDEYVNRLWENARKLGWSDGEQEKALVIYTELLTLIDEQSTAFNICAILHNRALSHRNLKNYDAALEDLARELEITQRRGDRMQVVECRKITEETQEWKRKAQIQARGGDKASKLKSIEEQAHGLWRGEPDFDRAFNNLFADLENDDPDIRTEASRVLADSSNALQKLVSIYQECLNSDPRRASLAGRVLGRKVAKGSDDMIQAQIAQIVYGISASFIPCTCVHCGHLNRGIAAPPSGPMVPYYSQSDTKGAYAIPVLCDKCGKEFFVVWDMVPR
jgi:tetratricopeptide (TPR) repeat protein